MFDLDTAQKEFGMKDIIYSIGFFDYLPDEFLVKLLSSLYLLLKPGGKLIASFKDANRYRPKFIIGLLIGTGSCSARRRISTECSGMRTFQEVRFQ